MNILALTGPAARRTARGVAGRLRFARGELDIDTFDPLFDGFRQFGPEGEAIADRYEVDDTPYVI